MLFCSVMMFLLSLCSAGDVQKIHHPCQNGTCPSFIQFNNKLGLKGSKMAMKDSNTKRCDLGNAVTLEQECKWKKHPGKYARGFAKGAESEFGPLAQMKARCLSMGWKCRAVTCKTDGNCRTSGTSTMSPSHSGETTYVPDPSQTNRYVCGKVGEAARAKTQATEVCEDHTFKKKEKWHDSDGPKYDCQWYQKENHCKTFGHGYENEGLTANEACCACGGGWTPTTTTTTSTTTTLTGATYDYIHGKSDCVRVQGTGQNLSAVEFSFKVKNWGDDKTWRPLWSAKWPGPIWPSIGSQSFDSAGKKKGTEYFKKWRLMFGMWLPLQNWFGETVEFSTPFEFFHEYDVKILYSSKLDKVKLFVHGEEKEDQKFTTPLCWMEVGSSVAGCDTNREIEFLGSVKSFKIGGHQ